MGLYLIIQIRYYFNKPFSSTAHCCYHKIPPTIDAAAFADPMEEFFEVLELEFLVKSCEIFLQLAMFSR
jgi:hypothetical protein